MFEQNTSSKKPDRLPMGNLLGRGRLDEAGHRIAGTGGFRRSCGCWFRPWLFVCFACFGDLLRLFIKESFPSTIFCGFDSRRQTQGLEIGDALVLSHLFTDGSSEPRRGRRKWMLTCSIPGTYCTYPPTRQQTLRRRSLASQRAISSARMLRMLPCLGGSKGLLTWSARVAAFELRPRSIEALVAPSWV